MEWSPKVNIDVIRQETLDSWDKRAARVHQEVRVQLETGVDSHSVSYLLPHIATKSVAFLRVGSGMAPVDSTSLRQGPSSVGKGSNYRRPHMTSPHMVV